MDKDTIIRAAFCGSGKSYLCSKYPDKYKELECWKYRTGKFPHNYVRAIKNQMGKVENLFISTDPAVLKQLHKKGIPFTLIFPENSLKEIYMQRYCSRNDSYDFIGVLYKHWDSWLDELKEQDYCEHIVLKDGEYLVDVI